MKRRFIYTKNFDNKWSDLGLTDVDCVLLEQFLLENPESGAIIQGTGGIRKLRWSLPSTGKSSGIRVLYIDYVVQETIVVFDLFTKSEKDNLSDSEKATLKRIVKLLGKELSNG
jgi:hypothetical protein